MPNDSDAWVARTAKAYRVLQEANDPTEAPLTAFLDVATTTRMQQVGFDQTIVELNAVMGAARK